MPQLTINTDDKFEATLQELVDSNPAAKTKADILQRAVATYKYLQDAVKDGNAQIQLVKNDSPSDVIESDIKLP